MAMMSIDLKSRNQILELRQAGWALRKIAKKVGWSYSTICRVIYADKGKFRSDRRTPAVAAAPATASKPTLTDLISFEILSVRLGRTTKAKAYDEIYKLCESATVDTTETDRLRAEIAQLRSQVSHLRSEAGKAHGKAGAASRQAKIQSNYAERFEHEVNRLIEENGKLRDEKNTLSMALSTANEKAAALEAENNGLALALSTANEKAAALEDEAARLHIVKSDAA